MKKFVMLSALLMQMYLVNANHFDMPLLKREDGKNTVSTLFKMSRNSNRLPLFENLKVSLKVMHNNQGTANSTYSSYNDVVELLGQPDLKINAKSIVYTLNPTTGCKAILEFDSFGTLIFVGIKDSL